MINFSIMSKDNGVIKISKSENIISAGISFDDLFDKFHKYKQWEDLLVFSMLYRVLGQQQKIIKFNRNTDDIESLYQSLWFESSKMMHFNKIDIARLQELCESLSTHFGVQLKTKPSCNDLIDTSELIDIIISSTNYIRGKTNKNTMVIGNFLESVRLRIALEKQISLLIGDKREMTNKIGDKKNPVDTRKSVETKSIRPFINKYSGIINNLSHTTENDMYKFFDINIEVLDNARSELEELIKK